MKDSNPDTSDGYKLDELRDTEIKTVEELIGEAAVKREV